jgi:hypothetical protein
MGCRECEGGPGDRRVGDVIGLAAGVFATQRGAQCAIPVIVTDFDVRRRNHATPWGPTCFRADEENLREGREAHVRQGRERDVEVTALRRAGAGPAVRALEGRVALLGCTRIPREHRLLPYCKAGGLPDRRAHLRAGRRWSRRPGTGRCRLLTALLGFCRPGSQCADHS